MERSVYTFQIDNDCACVQHSHSVYRCRVVDGDNTKTYSIHLYMRDKNNNISQKHRQRYEWVMCAYTHAIRRLACMG